MLSRLHLVPGFLAAACLLWGGLVVARSSALMGVVMVILGLVTIVLVFRMSRGRGMHEAVRDGDLSAPAFNYLVWSVLAVPLIFGTLLLIMVVTGWGYR
jgi:hypothetical protein